MRRNVRVSLIPLALAALVIGATWVLRLYDPTLARAAAATGRARVHECIGADGWMHFSYCFRNFLPMGGRTNSALFHLHHLGLWLIVLGWPAALAAARLRATGSFARAVSGAAVGWAAATAAGACILWLGSGALWLPDLDVLPLVFPLLAGLLWPVVAGAAALVLLVARRRAAAGAARAP